mmetsp:Transcript_33009/g.43448  ORF Transcript_33009/g.43448 Transcript_33009/m.43448 type:complete len:776 (-) Transcript_33009:356-2683(-)
MDYISTASQTAVDYLSACWEAVKQFASTVYSTAIQPAWDWITSSKFGSFFDECYSFVWHKLLLAIDFLFSGTAASYIAWAGIFGVFVGLVVLIDYQHFKTVLKERKRKSAKFSVTVPGTEKQGHGPIHRSVNAPQGIVPLIPGQPETTTLFHNFQHSVKNYNRMPCLGFRPIVDGKAGPYQWYNYAKVDEMARSFGSGLVHEGLLTKVDNFKPFALYCKNCPEWVIAEQGLYMYNGTTVPLYDTLGEESVSFVLNQTQCAAVLTTETETQTILKLRGECKHLKAIIQCSEISDEIQSKCDEKDINIYHFEQLLELGGKKPVLIEVPKPSDISTFCYTSGTTGDPKGVQLTHEGFVSAVAAAKIHKIQVEPGHAYLSYLPLAHVFERYVQAFIINSGGCIGFYQGNILKITEDIAALRPHVFCSVPRLLNRVHDKIMAGATASPVKKLLFTAGLNTKKQGLEKGVLRHGLWDKLVFGKVAKKIGLDRCNVIITGSAPLAAHVMDFLRCVFATTVIEGYGQTETSAAATIGALDDLTSGHVGAPISCCEMKLVAVSDMGYEPTDTKHGDLDCEGRGEIYFRGPNCMVGYYKMEEKTKETKDEEGWIASGDIGIWLPNGNLKIVDRKKNMFKLAQGEYVAAEKIEMAYCKNEFIAQAFVYGDSFQSALVAVFVPDLEYAEKWLKAEGDSTPLETVYKSEKFIKAITESIAETAKQEKLKGFEKVKKFHLNAEAFSADNGLLTPTFKLKRPEAKKFFQKEIDTMYGSLGSVAGQKVTQQ